MKTVAIDLKRAILLTAAVMSLGALAVVVAGECPAYTETVGMSVVAQDGPSSLWEKGMERTAQSAPLGGSCVYSDIPGDALITGVEKTPASSQQAGVVGGPGYEGLEVHYAFMPKAPIGDTHVRPWAERDHTLQLTNSWYPGPRYLEKYAIAKGKTFAAVLRVLTKGTCSPYIIEFPSLDLADYFETISRPPGSPPD